MAIEIPDMSNLSPTDAKILLILTRELSVSDASTMSGVPHEYCKKRMQLLKKKGLLVTRQNGNQFLYRTVRLPETEEYYTSAETKSNEALTYEFQFNGDYTGFFPHAIKLGTEKNADKNCTVDLITLVFRITSALKIRSYRKSLGQEAQWPSEDRMREYLIQRINLAKKELILAEELLNARGLWSGSPRVCEQLSAGPPTNGQQSAYGKLSEMF